MRQSESLSKQDEIIKNIKTVVYNRLDSSKYKVFLFGSRARGDFSLRSDYDIGVLGKEKIEFSTYLRIKSDLEDIPALIDFVDFARTKDYFKEEALKNIVYL